MSPTLVFIASCFAIWRLSHLLSNENGPFHCFKKTRVRTRALCVYGPDHGVEFFRKFHAYELVSCEYCNSVWFSTLLVTFYVIDGIVRLSLMPTYILSLSAVAILIKLVHELLVESKNWFIASRKQLENKHETE